MATTQEQIETVLSLIQERLEQIQLLKKQAMDIEAGLVLVREAFREYLGVLTRKAEEYRGREASLRDELRLLQGPDSPAPSSRKKPGDPSGGLPPPPPPGKRPEEPVKDPRAKRKRDLADYILDLVSPDQYATTMERINVMIMDERTDVGDMLEILPWGVFWRQRVDDESQEEQLARLEEWYQELGKRTVFWQGEVQRLQFDHSYYLYQEKQNCSEEEWKDYLAGMARDLEKETTRLARVVSVLEQELRSLRKGSVSDV